MGELNDYSGEFKPYLKMADFSKEALLRLLTAYARCYPGMDGLWFTLCREQFGDEKARELDEEIWANRALGPEAKRICEALNIEGDDVATLFKLYQTQPGFEPLGFEMEYELKDKNHGICTVRNCRSVEYFARHDDWDTCRWVCEKIDQIGFEAAAHYFNPDMIVTPLKLHPSSADDRPHCVWEYKVL